MSTGRVGKYLLYALGEIILVIIGILIALYINNWNQERQQVAKIEAVFEEILKDLETDILNAKAAIELQNNKDSLIHRVLMDSVSIDDYKRDGNLRNLIFNNKTMTFANNGYTNLVQYIDDIPEKYEHLVPLLNNLYQDELSDVQLAIDKVHDYVSGILKKWVNEQEWFSSYINLRQSDAYYEYVLKDPIYKNEIALYNVFLIHNLNLHTVAYHHKAVMTYREIAKMFNKPFPDFITEHIIDTPVEKLEQFVGKYYLESYKFVVEIEVKDEQLHLILNEGLYAYDLWARTESTYFSSEFGTVIQFLRLDNDSIVGLNYQARNFSQDMTRIALDSFPLQPTAEE